MALIDRARERAGSDASDGELEAMIDAITAELDARFGPAGEITVDIGDIGEPSSRFMRNLRLVRAANTAEPITITERDPGNSGLATDDLVLAADDFRVMHGGHILQRLTGGTNSREFWAPLVSVTYTPIGAAAQRDEVTIKLIQLDLSYRGGLRSERAGDYQFTLSGDMAKDREAILQTLEDRRGLVMS